MIFQLSEDELWFPEPELADEDGLLAIGGDLSAERLILAYQSGIFPWFSDDTPILWYAPHERFVLFPDQLKVSKTMRKLMNSDKFRITFDKAFPEVINACASISREDQEGTWITGDMQEAYINLFRLGLAHSVEVWENDQLVGGLYGIHINSVFCGESMFSKVSNASKAALIWLCQNKSFTLIDCQVHTSHLESLGAGFISMSQYLAYLNSDPK
ncbi:leucyl/phenylalanyl-tRNA--protein transferase [Daejeonella rubra]|uniref:Leucyl/phenylalanyl-tRNA--protein transferase n=1 Tax=Daejeonella rubra TaxID=990371 RepID=A0A1G9YGK1_9SPHI|nr:leucyl/phenylalanyl-tRNA--protein transferase [Daejeonella rubra]SDN08264.1 leucyl/phenylalanyl-tRNA--protein transferase [Daejeonella rubra]